jgi:hypothetical protein
MCAKRGAGALLSVDGSWRAVPPGVAPSDPIADLGVAGGTQGAQVGRVIRAAVTLGHDVVEGELLSRSTPLAAGAANLGPQPLPGAPVAAFAFGHLVNDAATTAAGIGGAGATGLKAKAADHCSLGGR